MPPNEIMSLLRRDLGNMLFHFTKEQSIPVKDRTKSAIYSPQSVLKKILRERKLKGGSGFIRGSHNCVCFTESPISELTTLFSLKDLAGLSHRYEPYGIAVKKTWLFEQGGRPVIYQPDSDYSSLPDSLQHRHVTYDLDQDIDFTWEREWRIKTDELYLPTSEMLVIVPTAKEAFEIMHEFSESEPNSYDDEGQPDLAGGIYTYPTILAVSLDLLSNSSALGG